ncbi:MAG: TIGR03790 family protein [Verrucomicrobia bacterium]|nr:TIGR03790 family protein [Verrucomicrobiota bacterium]
MRYLLLISALVLDIIVQNWAPCVLAQEAIKSKPTIPGSIGGFGINDLNHSLADSVLVVYNPDFTDSESLARYYAVKRGIPSEQVIGLPCSDEEEISRQDYDRTLAQPLRKILTERSWWRILTLETGEKIVTTNKIRYIVLLRGIPLKIRNTTNYNDDHPNIADPLGRTNQKAVDSELATLGYFRHQISGPLNNPFFRSFTAITDFDPRLMLVGRLDAPTAADVHRVIDDSFAAEHSGLWGWTYIDTRGTQDPAYRLGDTWLLDIADRSFWMGYPAIVDRKPALFPLGYPMTNSIFYFGWYSEQPAGVFLDPKFRFQPGAVAVHIHSFSAATVRQSGKNWAGPLIEHGAAATIGNVYEPYLQLTPMLNVFHDHFINGMTFAESAYASLAAISWMATIVGDPLYRPFGHDLNPSKSQLPWQHIRDLIIKDRGNLSMLVSELNELARSFPIALEVAGLLQMRANQNDAALQSFELAAKEARTRTDRFRSILNEADLLQRLHKQQQLSALIKKAARLFPDTVSQQILNSYLIP